MPVILGLSVLLQILCGLHVVKTGQDRYWLSIIIIGSYLGCLIYAFAVIIPHSLRSRQGKQAINKIQDKLNPTRHLQAINNQLSMRDTPQVRMNIADELVALQRYDEAIEHYQKALTPQAPYEPNIMLKLADAYFNTEQYDDCLTTLHALLEHNPGYASQEGHLLQARALHKRGDHGKADTVYQQIVEYYSGPQARLLYAEFLLELGRKADARNQLENILNYARIAEPHYRRFHKECLAQAKQLMKSLDQPA